MTAPVPTNVTADADVQAKLDAILRKLDDVYALLDRKRRVSVADRALMNALLPVLQGVFGDDEFNAVETMAVARSTNGVALRTVLPQGYSTRALGRLLKRMADHQHNGLRLLYVGRDREAEFYRVVH